MSVIVGIDVGGTFTDLFRFDPATRTFTTAKVPSRRGDEARGFLDGLAAVGDVTQGSIVHGTTVGTNSLLERRGAATFWKCAVATAAAPGACGAISRRSRIATCGSKSTNARSPTAQSAPRSTRTTFALPPGC
jgi:N-methylhydantoinase A/oxoprolinase/acetone carboxylase beta subunit